MEYLSVADKVELIRIVGENTISYRRAARIFNARHPDRRNPLAAKTVCSINRLFNETGCIKKHRQKKYQILNNRYADDPRIIAAFRNDPTSSIRSVARILNVSKNKVWRCLRRNRLKAFKPKFLHTIKDGDEERRLEYCLWLQGEYLNDLNFIKNIIFTDEATFSTNGVVSSQNTRYWAAENPHWVINCKDQYVAKVNVWCGILNNKILGPVFLENLNAETFLNLLNNYLDGFLMDLPLLQRVNLFFQLDGAPAHNSIVVRNWLNLNFPQMWIGRNSPLHEWPPRSPDITPMDFYFWGVIKNRVYKTRPRNRQELCEKITEACREVTPVELRRVLNHKRKRVEKCIRLNGGLVEITNI